MKKLFSLLLVFAMILSLCACGKPSEQTNNQSNVENSSSEAKTDENSKFESTLNETSFTIEEMEYELVSPGKDTECTNLYLKIRNNTEEYIDRVDFSMQAIDKNGDVLCDRTGCAINDLDASQGGWTDYNQMYKIPKNKIDKIRIIAYSIYERIDGQSNSYNSLYTYRFEKPIYINMSDFIER